MYVDVILINRLLKINKTKTKYSNKNEFREDIKHLNKDLNHKIFFFIMIYFGKKWGGFGKKYGRNDFRHNYQKLLIKKLLK